MLGGKVFIRNELKFKTLEGTIVSSLRVYVLRELFGGEGEVVHWIVITGFVLRKHRLESAHAWRFSV